MEEVIRILMKRDGGSYEDAKGLVESVLSEVQMYLEEGDMEAAEDCWMQDTGLEVDYLIDLMF